MPRGGARPGAGRPRKPAAPTPEIAATDAPLSPLALLESVMLDVRQDMALRVRCAKALLPYRHARVAALGAKAQREAEAIDAERGTAWAPLLAGKYRGRSPDYCERTIGDGARHHRTNPPTRPPPSAAGRRPSSARTLHADRDDGDAGSAPDLTPRTAANQQDRETSLLQGAKTGARAVEGDGVCFSCRAGVMIDK